MATDKNKIIPFNSLKPLFTNDEIEKILDENIEAPEEISKDSTSQPPVPLPSLHLVPNDS